MLRHDNELANLVLKLLNSEAFCRYLTAELVEENGKFNINLLPTNSDRVIIDSFAGLPRIMLIASEAELFQAYRELTPILVETYPNSNHSVSRIIKHHDFERVANAWNRHLGGAQLTYWPCCRIELVPTDKPEFPEGTTFLRIPLYNGGDFRDLLGIEDDGVDEDELPDDVLYNPERVPDLWIDVMHKPEESYLEIISDSQELLEKFIGDSKIDATIWRGNFDDRW